MGQEALPAVSILQAADHPLLAELTFAWVPIAVAAMSGVVGLTGIRETKDVDLRS